MMTEEQVRFIDTEIRKSPIRSKEIHDDLVDHYCCLIEDLMQNGNSFDEAYKMAYEQTTPGGFAEIHSETMFLLNKGKIILLQRCIYLSGYFFTLVLAAGFLFKKMSWPGATAILIAGVAGLLFIFLPLKLVNKYKLSVTQLLSEKTKRWMTGLTLVLVALAVPMQIAHLSGAGIVMVFAFCVVGFGLLPYLFFRMYKTSTPE